LFLFLTAAVRRNAVDGFSDERLKQLADVLGLCEGLHGEVERHKTALELQANRWARSAGCGQRSAAMMELVAHRPVALGSAAVLAPKAQVSSLLSARFSPSMRVSVAR
jgi:hypothetical protein